MEYRLFSLLTWIKLEQDVLFIWGYKTQCEAEVELFLLPAKLNFSFWAFRWIIIEVNTLYLNGAFQVKTEKWTFKHYHVYSHLSPVITTSLAFGAYLKYVVGFTKLGVVSLQSLHVAPCGFFFVSSHSPYRQAGDRDAHCFSITGGHSLEMSFHSILVPLSL